MKCVRLDFTKLFLLFFTFLGKHAEYFYIEFHDVMNRWGRVLTWSWGMQSVFAATEVAVVSSSTSPSLRDSARESFLTFSSHSVSLQNGVSTMSFLIHTRKGNRCIAR